MRTTDTSSRLPHAEFRAAPIHTRMTDLCRRAIASGEFAAGERFPSERELAEKYQVSRATGNKTISALAAEGLLEIHKGIGAIVKRRPALFASLAGMESFTTHMQDHGLVPSTQALAFQNRAGDSAPARVRRGFGIARGSAERLIYLERLRLANGEPMILEERWVRQSLAPGLRREDVTESFYRVLEEKFQLAMTGEEHAIRAELLDERASRLMRQALPAAALCVEGVGFVGKRKPLWHQRLLYHGHRYEIFNKTVGLGRSALALRLRGR